MVNRNLLLEYDVSDDDLIAVMGDQELIDETAWLEGEDVSINQIVEGRVIRVDNEFVVVDVGYKSEGLIPLSEWEPEVEEDPYGHDPEATEVEEAEAAEPEPPPEPGDVIRVLVEDVEDVAGRHDERGMLVLSKRKAERIEQWLGVMANVHEEDVVTGTVVRKIKGGLLVDIGVNVFLPASQVDIRRPHDIGEYIGKEIQCMVLKIDEERRNIVVSRRSLIEQERAAKKADLLKTLAVGDIRTGIVKNIADFGAFVDLGGIDGLLHITDMSWGRISHPSEMVKIEDELEVMVLHIDYEREKIALGLKQKSPSPWEKVPATYPVGTRIKGTVVNVMSYGAFVKLEDGIEGLVHISEMSWTKRISHPSELVQVDDEVEVVVLGINQEKQEISLGMKQTQDNPWDKVADRYPPGADVEGRVRNLTNYGAFIEIEEGIDGLLHVSDMSWTRKVSHPSEVVEKGQMLKCKILSVDTERRRIALGMKQLDEDPWSSDIPNRFQPGELVKGKVTKITNFGVFIGLEDGLEGLLHVSELSDEKVENPEELCNVGDEMEVKILRVDIDERKIGLSRKRVDWAEEDALADQGDVPSMATVAASSPTAGSENLKGGIGSGDGPLFKSAAVVEEVAEVAEEAPTAEVAEEAAPAEEAPAEEAPAEEAPTEEAPTEEAPTEEASTEEAPADEAPAEEASTEEAPADEEPKSEE